MPCRKCVMWNQKKNYHHRKHTFQTCKSSFFQTSIVVALSIECFINVSFSCAKTIELNFKTQSQNISNIMYLFYPESEFSPWYVKSPIENITALCGTLQFRYSHDKRLLLDSEKGKKLCRYSNFCKSLKIDPILYSFLNGGRCDFSVSPKFKFPFFRFVGTLFS